MQILSVGPVRTGSSVWQQRGSFVLVVVCKTTYRLKPGESVIAPEQEAINEADDHWDDDPNRSVRAPCDLVPAKVRPEVTLVGYAYAPNKQLVRSLVTRLIVGDVDKSIEVFCDRTFLPDGSLQEGQRFSRMRLSWERAGGGPHTNNPVGIRADARDAYGRRIVPNLQPLGMHVSNVDDFIPPVGYGPIAANWPSRADIVARAPQAVGEGLDGPSAIYYNAAPSDQLVSVLRESERIVLENLHPEYARLVTNLPGIRPAVFVDRGLGPAQRVPAHADTMWIDTDRGIATLTWRAVVPLVRRDEPGRVLVGMESPGQEMTFAAIAQAMVGEDLENEDDNGMETITSTISLNELKVSRGLPFAANLEPDPPPVREPMRSSPVLDLPFQPLSGPIPQAPPPPPSRPPWPSSPGQTTARPPGIKPPPVPTAPRSALPGKPVAPAPGAPPVALAAPPFAPPVPVSSAPAPPLSSSAPPQPPPVAPPVVLSQARGLSDRNPENAATSASPWASGTPGAVAAPRETLGTQAATIAAAPVPKEAASDGGALAASNDAAGVRPWSAPRRELRSVIATDDVADKPTVSRELLHLVWFEPSFVPRIRRVPAWKKLLSELEQRGPDKAIDDVLAGKEAWEIEDRREIFEILARGERADEPGVIELMDEAIRDDGKFATPIILVGCEVETPFDEIETLRALSAAAAALVGPTDESLKAAVEAADKFLSRSSAPWAPVVPEGLSSRIREAFVREKKGLPADALDVQAERALLGGRHYQKRDVLGDTFLRVLLRLSAENQPLVGYAPVDIAKKLPMFRRFRARLIGELHPWQDQYEARRESLRILALGTVTYIDRNAAAAKNG
ncbi:MAG: DUF2169 domain-containing protein [Polyangiaceae bacterium]|nr:DUF2169 domain-containing protein [Polyangiaceae bacterium]